MEIRKYPELLPSVIRDTSTKLEQANALRAWAVQSWVDAYDQLMTTTRVGCPWAMTWWGLSGRIRMLETELGQLNELMSAWMEHGRDAMVSLARWEGDEVAPFERFEEGHEYCICIGDYAIPAERDDIGWYCCVGSLIGVKPE